MPFLVTNALSTTMLVDGDLFLVLRPYREGNNLVSTTERSDSPVSPENEHQKKSGGKRGSLLHVHSMDDEDPRRGRMM